MDRSQVVDDTRKMIGSGGNTYPFPINGLSHEQNQKLCTAIFKMKVHDLQQLIMHLGLRKRTAKFDLQKVLLESLYDEKHARNLNAMVMQLLQYGSNGEMRRNQPAQRQHPYSRIGASNQMVNHHFQQQQQHQNMMHHMNHQHMLPNPMTVRWTTAELLEEQLKESMNRAAAPLQPSAFFNNGMHTSNQLQQEIPNRIGKVFADRFETVSLPFYDVINTLLEPVELHATNSNSKQSKSLHFTFSMNADETAKIAYRSEATPVPRYEVQLRFFNITEPGTPQKDDFPLNCHARVDESVASLPNIIPTNKPNVEPKRPSRPVNITSCLSRFKQRDHTLHVDWLSDRRVYAAGIYFVYRINSEMLFNRLVANVSRHRSAEVTRKEVINKLSGGEDDIAMDQLKISLLDPLSKIRVRTPVRCEDCTHSQCFDLLSYLMMNEKKPTWQCPVCSGYCPYERLIIDDYFLEVLAKVGSNIVEVELKPDGSYDVIKEEVDVCLSDDDDDEEDIKPNVNGSSMNGNGVSENGGKKKKVPADDEIITLSDDEEDEALKRGIQNSLNDNFTAERTGPSESSKRTPTKTGNNSDIEIITLDDTPPRPSAASAPVRQLSQQHVNNMASSSSSRLDSVQSPNNGPVPQNLQTALSQIGSQSMPHSSQPSPMMQQQQIPTSHQMNYGPPPFMNMGQASGSQTPTSQYAYSPMMQPQYQMQAGMIGRNNQMAPMQQHHQGPQGMMSPTFYAQQQMQNGFYFPPGQYPPQPQYRQN